MLGEILDYCSMVVRQSSTISMKHDRVSSPCGYCRFLEHLVPVAEEAGVRLAAHPDDPPVPVMRGAAKMIYKPGAYQRMLDLYP